MKQTTGALRVKANGSAIDLIGSFRHIERFSPGTLQKGLSQFDEPVSPHISAQSKTVRLPFPN